MKTEKTSRSMFAALLGLVVLSLAFGCSVGKGPSMKQEPQTAAELRAETERRAARYEVFLAEQSRTDTRVAEQERQHTARRKHDDDRFWEKQRMAHQ